VHNNDLCKTQEIVSEFLFSVTGFQFDPHLSPHTNAHTHTHTTHTHAHTHHHTHTTHHTHTHHTHTTHTHTHTHTHTTHTHTQTHTHTHTYIGPGSSVVIATDYGLDGPGSNPGGDEIFRRSRPALWPTRTMGTGSFPGVKCGRGVLLTIHPLLVPRSWKIRAISLPPLGPHRACNGNILPSYIYIYIYIYIYKCTIK